MQKSLKQIHKSNDQWSASQKIFYKFVKALRKDPCSIPTLVKDGLSYNTNILNQHFYLVFNKESSSVLPVWAQVLTQKWHHLIYLL